MVEREDMDTVTREDMDMVPWGDTVVRKDMDMVAWEDMYLHLKKKLYSNNVYSLNILA